MKISNYAPPDDPVALRRAAIDAERDGDMAHAKALRRAARFNERRIREERHGCAEVAIWMDDA